MAHTHLTARKSIGRLPVGKLAPQHMPPPQETQPDAPQDASQEEEPFEIELVVPESPTAQGSPAEEQQQPKDQDVEDEVNEEYPPKVTPRMRRCNRMRMRWSPSGLKLQFSPAGFKLCWSTWATPPPPATSRKSCVQGGWSSKPS
jgi:hypothetical protein